MPTMQPIDRSTWPRDGWFEHYLRTSPCTYAMTVELDVTALTGAIRRTDSRTYPAHIWALATVLRRHQEFRMCLTDDDEPAAWDEIHPAFTVLNQRTETFCSLWSRYLPNYPAFQAEVMQTIERFGDADRLFPQQDRPPNTFDVSAIPWSSFTGFTLNIENAARHLAPILTLGKITTRADRTVLPLAVQLHHAAADGFHAARLIREVQELVDQPDWLTG